MSSMPQGATSDRACNIYRDGCVEFYDDFGAVTSAQFSVAHEASAHVVGAPVTMLPAGGVGPVVDTGAWGRPLEILHATEPHGPVDRFLCWLYDRPFVQGFLIGAAGGIVIGLIIWFGLVLLGATS